MGVERTIKNSKKSHIKKVSSDPHLTLPTLFSPLKLPVSPAAISRPLCILFSYPLAVSAIVFSLHLSTVFTVFDSN